MQKLPVFTALTALFILSGCVSESTYVANERQVTQRSVDNTEAAKTRISLGLNYLRRGDSTQALFNLERAKTMAPNLPEVYNALAFYYQTVGEVDQAESAYKQAIAKDNNNADAYNNYGAFLCQIGKYQEAERLLLSAISKPGYIRVAESYENLALCQLEQEGFEQARTYLSSSISHNGTRISALINSASVNYAMGNLVNAKADLQRIQRVGRVSARSTLLNYLVAEKQGDISTMKHAEQLLLTLYIDSNEAKLMLQQRLVESEFEQLRERYKQKLLASIQPSITNAQQADTPQPVANPQLRIRRKTADTPNTTEPVVEPPSTSAVTRESEATPAAVVERPAAQPQVTAPRPTHSVAAIAKSFTQDVIIPAERPAPLPEETVLTADPVTEPVVVEPTAQITDITKPSQAAISAVTERPTREPLLNDAQPQAASKTATVRTGPEPVTLLPTETADTQTALTNSDKPAFSPSVVAEPEATAAPVNLPEPVAAMASKSHDVTTTEPSVAGSTEPIAQATVVSPEPTTASAVPSARAALDVGNAGDTQQTALPAPQPAVPVTSPASVDNTEQVFTPEPTATTQAKVSASRTEIENEQMLAAMLSEMANENVLDNSSTSAAASASTEVPFHVVAEGESLHSISVAYNIILARLQEWNHLTPTSRLRIGQKIWLAPNDAPPPDMGPPPVRLANVQPVDEYYHLVAEGDTMFAISYRYNIRLDRFLAWNNLTEKSRLTIGQKLYIVDPATINDE